MPANLPTFATKDEVPESFRDSYVEKEGKWVPDVEDVSGLKDSQRRVLKEKETLNDTLKKILGDSRKPEDVIALLEKHEQAEEDIARKKGDIDSIIEKRIKAVRDELEPRVKAGDEAVTKLQRYEFRASIEKVGLAEDVGLNPKRIDAALKMLDGDYVRRDKSGKLIVIDADGDETGESLEKLLGGRFKKDYPEFFQGNGGSGGGANGGNGEGRKTTQQGTQVNGNDAAALAAVSIDDIASGKVKVAVPD